MYDYQEINQNVPLSFSLVLLQKVPFQRVKKVNSPLLKTVKIDIELTIKQCCVLPDCQILTQIMKSHLELMGE